MNEGRTGFSQLCAHLSSTSFRRCVAPYKAENYVKSFPAGISFCVWCWRSVPIGKASPVKTAERHHAPWVQALRVQLGADVYAGMEPRSYRAGEMLRSDSGIINDECLRMAARYPRREKERPCQLTENRRDICLTGLGSNPRTPRRPGHRPDQSRPGQPPVRGAPGLHGPDTDSKGTANFSGEDRYLPWIQALIRL
jgi:hypothetical protein